MEKVNILGDSFRLNANVEVLDSFSGHADQSELLEYFDAMGGKKERVFLVHGEPEQSNTLQEKSAAAARRRKSRWQSGDQRLKSERYLLWSTLLHESTFSNQRISSPHLRRCRNSRPISGSRTRTLLRRWRYVVLAISWSRTKTLPSTAKKPVSPTILYRARNRLQSVFSALCKNASNSIPRNIDADVVHLHTWYSHFAGILAQAQLRHPHRALTVHSLEPLRPMETRTTRWRLRFHSMVGKDSHRDGRCGDCRVERNQRRHPAPVRCPRGTSSRYLQRNRSRRIQTHF